MHESAVDQASGLRRVMAQVAPQRGVLLNFLGAGEHPLLLARLSQAWSDAGLQLTVVTDFDPVFQAVQAHRRRFGLTILHALELGMTRQALERLAQASDLTVLALDDNRLARGIDLPCHAQAVLSGVSPESVATAYVRLKAGAGLGSPAEVCTLFDRVHESGPAVSAYQRLSQAASRFLGLRLSFGGVAPAASGAAEWQALAGSVHRWAGQRVVEERSMALH